MQFTDAKGSFDTTYETYCLGETKLQKDRRIADVIITGKVGLEESPICDALLIGVLQTEERYIDAWGGPPNIFGRVRLHDGLMVLVRYHEDVIDILLFDTCI